MAEQVFSFVELSRTSFADTRSCGIATVLITLELCREASFCIPLSEPSLTLSSKPHSANHSSFTGAICPVSLSPVHLSSRGVAPG